RKIIFTIESAHALNRAFLLADLIGSLFIRNFHSRRNQSEIISCPLIKTKACRAVLWFETGQLIRPHFSWERCTVIILKVYFIRNIVLGVCDENLSLLLLIFQFQISIWLS